MVPHQMVRYRIKFVVMNYILVISVLKRSNPLYVILVFTVYGSHMLQGLVSM